MIANYGEQTSFWSKETISTVARLFDKIDESGNMKHKQQRAKQTFVSLEVGYLQIDMFKRMISITLLKLKVQFMFIN